MSSFGITLPQPSAAPASSGSAGKIAIIVGGLAVAYWGVTKWMASGEEAAAIKKADEAEKAADEAEKAVADESESGAVESDKVASGASLSSSTSGGVPMIDGAASDRKFSLGQSQPPMPVIDGAVQVKGVGLNSGALYRPASASHTGPVAYMASREGSSSSFKPPVMGGAGWVDHVAHLSSVRRNQTRDLRGDLSIPVPSQDRETMPAFGPAIAVQKPVRGVIQAFPDSAPHPQLAGSSRE